ALRKTGHAASVDLLRGCTAESLHGVGQAVATALLFRRQSTGSFDLFANRGFFCCRAALHLGCDLPLSGQSALFLRAQLGDGLLVAADLPGDFSHGRRRRAGSRVHFAELARQIGSIDAERGQRFAAFLDGAVEESRKSLDRKSTRLNSSHVKISYAVFCLKKKKPK